MTESNNSHWPLLPSDPTATLRPPLWSGRGATSNGADASSGDSLPAPLRERSTAANASAFELLQVIGQGGHGEVWEARQATLGRLVAVKRLSPPPMDGSAAAITGSGASGGSNPFHNSASLSEYELAFRQEALVAAHLEHPNIVPVHDLGFDAEGRPLLAMKLVRGRPWDRMIAEDWSRLEPSDFLARHLRILSDIAQAAAFAHSRGIVHRDLKPSQVMVGEFGEAVLMDWGLAVSIMPPARWAAGESSDASSEQPGAAARSAAVAEALPADAASVAPTLLQASNPAGTPAYMAPEQTERSATGIGPWTDVYLLGGMLYYLLTGTPPHGSASPRAAFERARDGSVEPASERKKDRLVPGELEALAASALSPNPVQRLSGGARAFVEGMQNYLSGANRRSESAELAERVASLLSGASGDYAALGELAGQLDRARVLWPDNPSVLPLAEQIREEIAASALANGDLRLARIHTQRLAAGIAQRRLLARITGLEAAVARRERQRRTGLRGVGVLVVALAIVAALDLTNSRRDARERIELAFQRSAEGQSRAFGQTVARALDAIDATASYINATGPAQLTRRNFENFGARLLGSPRGLVSLAWIPRVQGANANAPDADASGDTTPNGPAPGLSVGDATGSTTPQENDSLSSGAATDHASSASATLADVHFPILYSVPSRSTMPYRNDAASTPERRQALMQAGASGQLIATGRVTVPSPDNQNLPPGIVVFAPVFSDGDTSTSAPTASAQSVPTVAGFVAGTLKPSDLIDVAGGGGTGFGAVAFDLFDETVLPSRPLVVRGTGVRDEDGEDKLSLGMRFETTHKVAGRRWRLVAMPTPGFLAEPLTLPRRLPWAMLAGGAALLALIFFTVADRRESRRIARLLQGQVPLESD